MAAACPPQLMLRFLKARHSLLEAAKVSRWPRLEDVELLAWLLIEVHHRLLPKDDAVDGAHRGAGLGVEGAPVGARPGRG